MVCDALKKWKLNIFKNIYRRISFYSQNTNMLPRKPKNSYRYLKLGMSKVCLGSIRKKTANNVVVI